MPLFSDAEVLWSRTSVSGVADATIGAPRINIKKEVLAEHGNQEYFMKRHNISIRFNEELPIPVAFSILI
jgi:hypothetical protein